MESETRSTIATPLAIVGFGMASISYLAKGAPAQWLMATAFGLLVVGMMRNLQEEAGLGDLYPNAFSVLGNVLATFAILWAGNGTGWLAMLASAAFLWNGIVHAMVWKKKAPSRTARILALTGAFAMFAYFTLHSYGMFQSGDTSMLFASSIILAVYFGITMGIDLGPRD